MDIAAMIGTSAALAISGIPFAGPIGAARVGYVNGEYVLNPGQTARKLSDLDLIVRFEPGRSLFDHGGLMVDLEEAGDVDRR